MRLTRIFLDAPLKAGEALALPESAGRHLIKVLRLRAGDPVTVFNGSGEEYGANLGETRGRKPYVEVRELLRREPEPALRLTLLQAVSRAESMDFIVQKATELGVRSIVPVLTQRTLVRLDGERAARRQRHWQAVATRACEQCGRNRLPDIAPPTQLEAFIDGLKEDDLKVLLDPAAELSHRDLPAPKAQITLLVGPEGGLEGDETEAAMQAGFVAVGLGPRILRTETAAVAMSAILQSRWGDIG